MTPVEAISEKCPDSPYKDDRHYWYEIMHEEAILTGMLSTVDRAGYYLKKCLHCHLCVLSHSKYAAAQDPPQYTIIHAFYEEAP